MIDKLMSRRCLIEAAAGALLLSGCSSQDESSTKKVKKQDKIKKAESSDGTKHLRDKDELYEVYDDSGIVTMYLTVSRGNSSENTDHSWAEINTYSVYDYADMVVTRYQVMGLLQPGDEEGPVAGEVGYGEEAPNATVQVRGQTSSGYTQKNYKVELKKGKGTWRQQRAIALNKHMGEGSLEVAGDTCFDVVVDCVDGAFTAIVDGELPARFEMRFTDEGRASAGCGRAVRWEPIDEVRNVRIVGDVSSVEVFVNDGALVFSTRIYPEAYGVTVDAPGANVTYHALNI